MSVWIRLTPEQMEYARDLAERRDRTNRAARVVDKIVATDSGVEAARAKPIGWIGTTGEVAVCHCWLGYPLPVDDLEQARVKAADCGDYEVRARSVRHYDVVVKRLDPPGRKTIAAVADPPDLDVEILGWFYAGEAMHDVYLDAEGHRDWRYPIENLRPLTTMPMPVRR